MIKYLDDGLESYVRLAEVLRGAYDQAASGKGKERHATDEAFEDQKICVISRWISGSPIAGVLFQAIKKAAESSRLPADRAIRELRGAINYLAAGIILLEEQRGEEIREDSRKNMAAYQASLCEEIDKKLFQDDLEDYVDRSCGRCKFSVLPQWDMPCKKCFHLDIKPHFKREL